jgi:PAS domain S-box-containing protein
MLKPSLERLLVGLTGLAILVVVVGHLAFLIPDRVKNAEARLTAETGRLTAAASPLLLNALVVGDLATAEQTLRNLNGGRVWRVVRLYEEDGRTVILDASPPARATTGATTGEAPEWFRHRLGLRLEERRVEIRADPVIYGVLAVTPSFHTLENDLWDEISDVVIFGVALFLTSMVLVKVILAYGLRPIRTLARAATRLGSGDLTVRMRETRLAEIAPTVQAFNAMAGDLQRLMAELVAKEAANRRLAAIVEQSGEAILTVDLGHRITSWNPGAYRLYGRAAEEAIGEPLESLFGSGGSDAPATIARLIDTRLPRRFDTTMVGPAGRPVPVSASSSPLHDESGAHAGYIIVARDISDRKRAESEMRRAKEQAEAGNRAKADFVATMSHEIRTPMNGVIGLTDLLLDTELTPQQREYLGLVKTSANALLWVVNDVLDFSKIEAGRIELEATDFSLRTILGHALKPFALDAHRKGLELVSAIRPDVPDTLVGDPARLRQVLVNLVGNALKFTELGEVGIHAEIGAEHGDGVEIHFAVSDTGIGVPEAKRHEIFEAFTQADSSTTRRHGGTGLGLAITKRLVELIGGRIWLESREGHGSTFHFTARFQRSGAPAADRASLDPARLRGLSVLVVDDNATSRRILAAMLTDNGLRPVVAAGAEEASAWLGRAVAAGEPPAAVITDHQMPDVDGLSLARRIKADPALAQVPIVMVSSSGLPSDAALAREVGIAGYLTKPVTQAELLDALLAALGHVEATAAAVRPASARCAPMPGQSLRVLLAEDNAVNRKVALAMLERLGHRVVVVEDGRAALAALEAQPFDLVLMDVQMPEMDGFAATAAIRAWEADVDAGRRQPPPGSSFALRRPGGERLPVVAMTAHALGGDEARCLAAGMDAYMAKPIKAETLADVLEPFGGSAADGSPAADAPPVDLDIALRMLGGDADLLEEAGRLFVEEAPRQLHALQEALSARDSKEVRRLAHSLRGSTLVFGAKAAAEIALRLESLGEAGLVDEAAPVLPTLEAEVRRIVAFLDESSGAQQAPSLAGPA